MKDGSEVGWEMERRREEGGEREREFCLKAAAAAIRNERASAAPQARRKGEGREGNRCSPILREPGGAAGTVEAA